MPSIQKYINKASKCLRAKGIMPLINQEQFYGDNGPVKKYIVHYGRADTRKKDNDVVGTAYGKKGLLDILVKILKEGGG